MEFFQSFSFLGKYYPLYISGTIATILISLFTVLFGALLGIVLALMKLSNSSILKKISSIYIEIIRGTPVIIQVFISYLGISELIRIPDIFIGGMDISRLVPGVIALSLNSAAYVAEIIRAGINAVDKGQREAAQSLGMKNSMLMQYIVMPQAVKNILPALGNEFVVLIKESSILYAIGIQELMSKAQTVQSSTYLGLQPLFVAAVIYFILTFSLSKLLGRFERRMNKDDRDK